MKRVFLFLFGILLLSCNNNTNNNNAAGPSLQQMQCSGFSDAALMEYKGKVQQVIERQYEAHDSNGMIVANKEAHTTKLVEFDSTGQVTKFQSIANGGRNIEVSVTYEHQNGKTIARHFLSIYKHPHQKDDIMHRNWVNQKSYYEIRKAYFSRDGKDTILTLDSTAYELDEYCRIIQKQKTEYRPELPAPEINQYRYTQDSILDYRLKPDSDTELKVKYWITGKDANGNPLKKICTDEEKTFYGIITYTYKYY